MLANANPEDVKIQTILADEALRNKDVNVLVSLLNNEHLNKEVDAKLAKLPDAAVVKAWMRKPGRNKEEIVNRVSKEKRVTVLQTVAELTELDEQTYQTLWKKPVSLPGRVKMGFSLINNHSVNEELKTEIKNTIFDIAYKKDLKVELTYEQLGKLKQLYVGKPADIEWLKTLLNSADYNPAEIAVFFLKTYQLENTLTDPKLSATLLQILLSGSNNRGYGYGLTPETTYKLYAIAGAANGENNVDEQTLKDLNTQLQKALGTYRKGIVRRLQDVYDNRYTYQTGTVLQPSYVTAACEMLETTTDPQQLAKLVETICDGEKVDNETVELVWKNKYLSEETRIFFLRNATPRFWSSSNDNLEDLCPDITSLAILTGERINIRTDSWSKTGQAEEVLKETIRVSEKYGLAGKNHYFKWSDYVRGIVSPADYANYLPARVFRETTVGGDSTLVGKLALASLNKENETTIKALMQLLPTFTGTWGELLDTVKLLN